MVSFPGQLEDETVHQAVNMKINEPILPITRQILDLHVDATIIQLPHCCRMPDWSGILQQDHAHLLPELPVVYCGCGLGDGVILILHITARLLDHIKAMGGERRGEEGRGGEGRGGEGRGGEGRGGEGRGGEGRGEERRGEERRGDEDQS